MARSLVGNSGDICFCLAFHGSYEFGVLSRARLQCTIRVVQSVGSRSGLRRSVGWFSVWSVGWDIVILSQERVEDLSLM